MEKNFLRMSLEELEQMVREAQKLDQLCGAMNTHKLWASRRELRFASFRVLWEGSY